MPETWRGPSGQAAVEAEPPLQVPSADYRREWVELGTYAVLADNPADGAKKMHFVYTERKNLEAYLKTGSFPDGTVLVKDVFAGKTGTFTTGTVSYAGGLLGRFVLVRLECEGELIATLRRELGLL